MALRLALALLSELRGLRERDGWTRPPVEAHQAESLRRLRDHTVAHSPFHQPFHKGLEDRPARTAPSAAAS